MKKLMLGLLIAFAVTAEAAVTIDGFKYELNTGNKTASLTGYEGSPMKVDVGEVEWMGEKYTVTSVGVIAFDGCSSLASVSLPNATTIGEGAFQDCSLLASVSLPNATTIGMSAFQACSSLTSVSLPNATTIGESVFFNCSSLTSVSLPNATTIGEGAFQACSLLASVSLLNATTIGDFAFFKCSSLASVSLLNATTIGESAFQGCSSLVSVELPAATMIGASAFLSCKALSSLFVNVEMKSAIETKGRPYYGISSGTTITYYDGLPYSVVKAAEYEMALRSGGILFDTDEYKRACEVFGITPKTEPQVVGADEIAVKKESIQSPSAGTVTVEANKVQLGVTILRTSDPTAEKKDWGEVTLTADDVKVENGKIVISVPVDSASGFMILQSGDAKVSDAAVTHEPWYTPTAED